MKLTKCEHGHFYDADKYPGCPYCDSDLRKSGSTIAAAICNALLYKLTRN